MKQQFAKVAVNLSTNRPIQAFTYKIPEREAVHLGQLVVVPFRNSVKAGYVIGFDKQPQAKQIKTIVSIIKELSLTKESQALAKWIAENYLCSEWAATKLFLPPGSDLKIKLTKESAYKLHVRRPRKEITQLEPVYLEDYKVPSKLIQEQQIAIDAIEQSLSKDKRQVFLLQGITGSGKTEVYAQIIEKVIKKGKSAILLVPEIAMSYQIVSRLSKRFKGKVAVLHSGLNSTERLSQWNSISEGKVSLVIGARSAIFAPFKNIGLIIVDEEHESAYKQNRTPRYNGRDVAIKRAELSKAVCILGSATPSLESRYKAEKGDYQRLILKTKPSGSHINIELVDMKELDEKSILSSVLIKAIEETLNSDQKVLLLLNRRGFSSFLLCPSCGFVAKCKRCSVSLTYHQTDKKLKCHHCAHKEMAPNNCPSCGSNWFRFAGSGTQKLEEKIKELFPDSLVIRLDKDTSANKSVGNALNKFRQTPKAILLGTQIVGKGFDFADIGLVGIVNADTSLNFPDFRAGERTFQLLHQVAGRCGRGKIPGKVIIQTYNNKHYAIKAVMDADYENFYNQEIAFRKELNYPPYVRLLNIGFSSLDYKLAKQAAEDLAEMMKEFSELEILGPVEAPIARLKGRFRWHMLVKSKKEISTVVRDILIEANPKKVVISLDVDPVSLL